MRPAVSDVTPLLRRLAASVELRLLCQLPQIFECVLERALAQKMAAWVEFGFLETRCCTTLLKAFIRKRARSEDGRLGRVWLFVNAMFHDVI